MTASALRFVRAVLFVPLTVFVAAAVAPSALPARADVSPAKRVLAPPARPVLPSGAFRYDLPSFPRLAAPTTNGRAGGRVPSTLSSPRRTAEQLDVGHSRVYVPFYGLSGEGLGYDFGPLGVSLTNGESGGGILPKVHSPGLSLSIRF